MTSINEILKAEKMPPVIFLYGKEEFLSEEAFQLLMKALIKTDADRFNFDSFDCSDKNTTPEKIAGACNSLPMMGERRITAITNFEAMFSLSTGKKADLERNPLVHYIENPSPSTILIIRAGQLSTFKNFSKTGTKKKIDSAKLPYNYIFGKHQWLEFPEIYDSQIPSWIVNRFRSLGYSIDLQAANVLAAQVDTNLRVIANTIERIITHYYDKKTIKSDDVNYLIGQSRHYNVFELEKAVGKRNLGLAIDILNNMLKNANEEVLIIARLTSFFSILWKLAEETRKGMSGPALAGTVGVHPAFLKDYILANKAYSVAEVSSVFLHLTEADVKLKTTQTDRFYLMQDLIIKIIDKK